MAGGPRLDWRRLSLSRGARAGGPRSRQTRVVAAVVGLAVVLIVLFLLMDGDGDDGGKKKEGAGSVSASGGPSASASASGEESGGSGVTVTARQTIGLEVRERPGAGDVLTEVREGAELRATCVSGGPNVYGWRGGKSTQWLKVSTDEGAGFVPEAWVTLEGRARDVLPRC